jgi:hypothetical protein
MPADRILASATVDVVRPSTPKSLGTFKVEVWGKEPNDYVRTYEIVAKSDTMAAQEGIRRFCEEIGNLPGKDI